MGSGVSQRHSRRSVLATVVRRSGPHFIEASVVPAVIFYSCLVAAGLTAAYLAALAYAYGAVVLRRARGRAVPPLLLLAVIGLSIRTVVATISDSSFVYFLQPVLTTVAMGGVFLGSVLIGRPLIASLAHEFWPITAEDAACPGVSRLFRNLTLLWAGVNLATAAATMTLLLVLPVAPFVVAKQLSGWIITGSAIYITVSSSLRMARREGLAAAFTVPG
ncbi:MAG: putative rane protein [Actinomycetia bacterium]|nr:putative rane protein [Actinomycetes bacterium]